MNASERRVKITHILKGAEGPVPASALAAQCSVSRQIIVGDIALLRAGGLDVLATPRGYILEKNRLYSSRSVACRHEAGRIREELCTVVDLGGAVIDVTVEHPIYGHIRAPLHIFSRFDVDAFCEKINSPDARPLCDLTSGIHLHTLRAVNDEVLDRVVKGLCQKGFLLPDG